MEVENLGFRKGMQSFDAKVNGSLICCDDTNNVSKLSSKSSKDPFPVDIIYTNVACTMVHSSWSSLWRETAQNPPYPIKGEGVYGHGRLHWMVDWVLSDERKIVWFDVNTEEFGSRDPPNAKEGGHWDWDNQLVDLNGELGFSYFGPFVIKLWILKQLEEWVLRCCFDLSPILLPPYNTDTCDIHIKISGCWNSDGDILLNYDLGERLFVYSLKSGVLREVDLEDSCKGSDIRVYQSGLFSLQFA